MSASIQGALQAENSLSEIAANYSQSIALTNLGAPSINQLQTNYFNYTATVTASTGPSGMMYTAIYNPPITEYVDGMVLAFRSPATNLGSSTFNAGAGAYQINGLAYSGLQGGELATTASVELMWNANNENWQIVGGGYRLQVEAAAYSLQAPQWGQVLAGNNAQWYNESASRTLGTTYTNTKGKPISVSWHGNNSTADESILGYVNGVTVTAMEEAVIDLIIGINFIVPAGDTYMINWSGGTDVSSTWFELY